MEKNLQEVVNRIAYKKRLLDQYRPLPDVLVKNLEEYLRIELTYTSNALEGNTLTRQETALVVDEDLSVPGKSVTEIFEAVNHNKALKFIRDIAKKKKIQEIDLHDILAVHKLILGGVDDQHAGCYRTVAVRIKGSRHIPPNAMKVYDKMQEVEKWLKSSKNEDPLFVAMDLHYKVVTIHPFVDGNGRTSRLLFNLILLIGGFPLSFVSTGQRDAYLSSLESAQTESTDKENYYLVMLQAVERSLDMYLHALQDKLDATTPEENVLYKIGELARITWESVVTLRYRTKEALLPIHKKGKGSYAFYDSRSIALVKKIRQLKEDKRYTLEEIKKILGMH